MHGIYPLLPKSAVSERYTATAVFRGIEAAGDGELIQNLGTSTGSRKVQAYNGKAMIRVKVTDTCYLSVQSDGIKTAYTQLKAQ